MVSIITLKLIKPPNTIYKWDATKTEKAFWFISYKRAKTVNDRKSCTMCIINVVCRYNHRIRIIRHSVFTTA